MNLTDLVYLLEWWFLWFLIGAVFFPLTSIIFHNFFDKGYALSKILGVLLISYTAWVLGSLKILPFNTLGLFIIWLLFVIVNSGVIWMMKRHRLKLPPFSGHIKIYLLEEILFLGGLIFWGYVRAHEPSIHGLEKFMDFGFINSILRSEYFPPKDLWMTPLSINYYYFGHLVGAVMTKISGFDPAITYNLILAAIFGITLSASFSISANIFSRLSPLTSRLVIISGLLSAFLVTLGGNLHTIYIFFQNYLPDNPVPFWSLPLSFNTQGYWYPNATRFIPFTIHEFPSYSFVVADLHGHVLNIPFVLLTLALLTKIFFQNKLLIWDILLLGLLIAISLMTNVLDGPIYLLIIGALFLLALLKKHTLKPALWQTLKVIAPVVILAIIFSLPYWLAFTPFAQGIGVLCAPQFLIEKGNLGPFIFEAKHCDRSPLWMLGVLWGFPYFLLLGFVFLVLKLRVKNLFESLKVKIEDSDYLVLVLAFGATFLILIPEFFYAKDIYPAHYRANTVFKFGYQAFIILGLISGYMMTRLISNFKFQNSKFFLPYYLLLITFFVLVAIYPYFATNSYYGQLQNYQNINGLNYLSPLYPEDYQAILWLRKNIQGQPVILEGQGDSYTDYSRVSSNTGLPTIIGWPVHEWLWRGSYDEPGKRIGEVTSLYENPDINLTKQLLERYNVSYVFVGTLERQKYLQLKEDKFASLGKTIYQIGNTKVYQINP